MTGAGRAPKWSWRCGTCGVAASTAKGKGKALKAIEAHCARFGCPWEACGVTRFQGGDRFRNPKAGQYQRARASRLTPQLQLLLDLGGRPRCCGQRPHALSCPRHAFNAPLTEAAL